MADDKKEIAALREQIQKLEAEKNKLSSEKATAEGELNETRDALKKSEAARETLVGEITELKAQIASLSATNAPSEVPVETMTSAISAAFEGKPKMSQSQLAQLAAETVRTLFWPKEA